MPEGQTTDNIPDASATAPDPNAGTTVAPLTEEQRLAQSLITKGIALHEERERNTKQTALNRDMLRGLAGQDMLTGEQAAKVAELYPMPQRKAKATDTPALDRADADRAEQGQGATVTGGPVTPPAKTPEAAKATPAAKTPEAAKTTPAAKAPEAAKAPAPAAKPTPARPGAPAPARR